MWFNRKFFIIIFLVICINCKKEEILPVLITSEVAGITGSEALCGGTILSDGGKAIIERGVCWSIYTDPTIYDNKTSDQDSSGIFISYLTELKPSTKYFIRAYATNSNGIGYGQAVSFTTLGQAPLATTLEATQIESNGATLNGRVNANYLSTIVTFEFGTTKIYGNYITALQSLISGNFDINVSAIVVSLLANTTYHYRVKSENQLGVTYGEDTTFTTGSGIIFNPNLTYNSINDIDGNTYKTIKIGTQIWMAQNLKTTKYQNGNLIGTTIPDTLDISNQISPKYQWIYGGDKINLEIYGRLYTWYAVTDVRNICPVGWHVPNDFEWNVLVNFVGGQAGKLKEISTAHWYSPNKEATNESGFTALPGGYRYLDGTFYNFGAIAYLWSSTQSDSYFALGRFMSFYVSEAGKYSYPKHNGFSVRCLKN